MTSSAALLIVFVLAGSLNGNPLGNHGDTTKEVHHLSTKATSSGKSAQPEVPNKEDIQARFIVHLILEDFAPKLVTSWVWRRTRMFIAHQMDVQPAQIQLLDLSGRQLQFIVVKSYDKSTGTQFYDAKNITKYLAVNVMAVSLPELRLTSMVPQGSDGNYYVDVIFTSPYLPVVLVLFGLTCVVLLFILIWCCVRRRDKHGPEGKASTEPQICVFPSAKPDVLGASLIQPPMLGDAPQHLFMSTVMPPSHISATPQSDLLASKHHRIASEKACGGCGAPRSPLTSPLSSPIYPSSPLATRSKAKGLLERRGSNASLTIELGGSKSSRDCQPRFGSPPRESSPLEYLQSAGHRMTRKELRKCLLNPRQLHEEFWEIPMNHPEKLGMPGSGLKNRYKTILPNEAKRVQLEELNDDPLTTYINANYIRGYGGDGHSFIATQGPMSNTITDFWRMIWQEKAPIVVMITKLKEQNKAKCDSYIPQEVAEYGQFEVRVDHVDERLDEGYVLRRLVMRCEDQLHELLHYWYTAWPDHKAPSTATPLVELCKEVSAQRTTGPVVVHCSAGIGRTGCFIATCIGMQQLYEEHMVDVLGIVCSMRQDRGGMVQTNEQYEFIHYALSQYEEELPARPPSLSEFG